MGTFEIAGMTASQAVNPIVYTLVSGGADNGLFTTSNGQLRSKTSLDYETRPSYSIKVRATDAPGKYVEQVIGISLLNVVGA